MNSQKIIIISGLTLLVALVIAPLISAQVSDSQCADIGQEGDVFGAHCCSGLTPVPINVEPINGACLKEYPPYGTQFLCIKAGDGVCGAGENKCNCPQDCGKPEMSSVCGNGICEKGEDILVVCTTRYCNESEPNCPTCRMACEQDCGAVQEPIMNYDSVCGNGICEHEICKAVSCDGTDERQTCPQDCEGQKLPVKTDLNITLGDNNGTGLVAELSNGKKSEIKIMPEIASQTAIEKLSLNACSAENNCTIELKEAGSSETAKPVYEVKADKEYRFLWFFKIKSSVMAQVNAETGEIVSAREPWWSFLAW